MRDKLINELRAELLEGAVLLDRVKPRSQHDLKEVDPAIVRRIEVWVDKHKGRRHP